MALQNRLGTCLTASGVLIVASNLHVEYGRNIVSSIRSKHFWMFSLLGIFFQPFGENTFSKKKPTQNEHLTRSCLPLLFNFVSLPVTRIEHLTTLLDYQCPKHVFVANHLQSPRTPKCCSMKSIMVTFWDKLEDLCVEPGKELTIS